MGTVGRRGAAPSGDGHTLAKSQRELSLVTDAKATVAIC
jgi:hypothetical protein